MSELIHTPHIVARKEDFADTVLMPGDPMRAKFIAENYLSDARLVNNVRGIHGYTGTYKGIRVSVMGSGMGMPSMGIYSYELFNLFDVENIIRLGSTGAYNDDLRVRDLVIAMSACTTSRYGYQFDLPGTFAPTADYRLLRICADNAERLGYRHMIGTIVSSDLYYEDDEKSTPSDMTSTAKWRKMGVLSIEMETAALYMNAARAGKHALSVCTVSNHVVTGEALSTMEREQSFNEMMVLGLETAASL